VQKDEGAPIVH